MCAVICLCYNNVCLIASSLVISSSKEATRGQTGEGGLTKAQSVGAGLPAAALAPWDPGALVCRRGGGRDRGAGDPAVRVTQELPWRTGTTAS